LLFCQTELPDLRLPFAAAVSEVFVLAIPLIAYAPPFEPALTVAANPAAENSSDRGDHLLGQFRECYRKT
jgi:hypothetical protein